MGVVRLCCFQGLCRGCGYSEQLYFQRIGKMSRYNLEVKNLCLRTTQLLVCPLKLWVGLLSLLAGTRVPVQTLLDYLKAGESIDDFLDGFPTVTKEQLIVLLEEAGKQLMGMVAL